MNEYKYGLMIHVGPNVVKVSRWGKIKMAFWNFILPPHVRLDIKEHGLTAPEPSLSQSGSAVKPEPESEKPKVVKGYERKDENH